ncbi:hypothetical protein [Caballeronia sp. dw_19]|uniref:hypothetical protein n=1 Tax=Caballeronia sp. dw_19 TaxID=2719791 RepID=UPI001BD6808B|nr:hypothetical protein [Caballeronia sp. dw_19]
MNAPMVVVQGDLLLPTLFPLATMPNAVYGEEWTLTGTRPVLTEYEIPFYAARFLTAYVSALSLRNDRFPYTPCSLWGKFKRIDEVNHAEQGAGVPPAPVNAAPQAAEPAPFAFEPFTAPDDRHVKTPAANHDHRKQLAGGAIALACAAFIAWALFGTKIGHQDTETQKPEVVLSAIPAIKPTSDSDSETIHASGASSATVVVASPSTGASTSDGASMVASAAARTVASAEASATHSAAAASVIAALPAVQKTVNLSSAIGNSKPSASPATRMNVMAGDGRTAAPNAVSERATKAQTVAQPLERRGSKAKLKTKAKGKRDAHRYEVVYRRHGHEYRGTPVYRSTGHEAPLTSPGHRVLTRNDTASSSLSVTDMYNMLAHSAVLDDNSGAARQPVRVAPREAAASPSRRSSGSDSPNWNSDLSQRRVTDTPSQFSK